MAWSWKGNNEPVIDMSSDWAGTNLTSWGKTAVTGTYGTKTAATCSAFLSNTVPLFPENTLAIGPEIKVSLHSLLKGIINFELHGLAGATTIKIMDITGKQIQEELSVDQKSIRLDKQVGPGVYLVKVINGQSTFDRKIFVR